MKKKYPIKELLGHELHVAVAICLGYVPTSKYIWFHKDDPARTLNMAAFAPSTDGKDVMNIMEEFWIGVERPSRGQKTPVWRALGDFRGDRKLNPMGNVVDAWGPTYAIAAMRCFVGMFYFEKIEMSVPALRVA